MSEDRFDGLDRRALADGLCVIEADTLRSRSRGLARMDALDPGLGLHIHRCKSIQTLTMRFPLDLIWLDKRGAVVRVDRDIPPRRMKNCLKASSVIEVNAGQADAFVAAGA